MLVYMQKNEHDLVSLKHDEPKVNDQWKLIH